MHNTYPINGLTTIDALSSDLLGDLDRVARIVKLNGYVQCVDGYTGQPKVINGASDLLAEVRVCVFLFFLRTRITRAR